MRLKLKELMEKEGITIPQLSEEMSQAGIFKNKKSAYDMIHYHLKGKAKSCDWTLLKYLVARFNVSGTELIEWNK